jgi:plastocyanin
MGPVAVLLLAATIQAVPPSTGLVVEVRDGRGSPVTDAVVYAVPVGRVPPPPTRRAVVDQKNRMFIPHILPIQTGTAVSFPNSDNVRHQVYSFSPAKRFQLPLYSGTPAEPIVFDKPGVVAIGCNIHDQMSAYLVVVDTPHFAKTVEGRTELAGLPEGRYDVRVWTKGMRTAPPTQSIRVGPDGPASLTFRLGDR